MTKPQTVLIYDTTLRDGTQAEGVSFSKADKVRIAKRLDAFGVAYLEGGWPASNPKDMAFFADLHEHPLKHARLVAFGSTRRAQNRPEADPNLQALIDSQAPVVTIFGKSWLFHVHEVLRVSPDENLAIIGDSCRFLRGHGREVVFDAEHFFDGFRDDPDYALQVLRTAAGNGATTIVLCDTNGGMLPGGTARVTEAVRQALPPSVVLGIHCHNDSDCAVANSLAAVEAGATHVQGTINGFGERCGNANLCSIMAALELKMGRRCVHPGSIQHLTELGRFVYDLANVRPHPHQAYIGTSAFAHKGGMHVNAVQKNPRTFEHIAPELVGNRRRILVSELAGGSNIIMKAAEHDVELDHRGPEVKQILAELKRLESQGYEYEAADGSFRLFVQKQLRKYQPFFKLEGFRVIIEKRGPDVPCLAEATIKVTVGNRTELAAAEGDGPVNALDQALRKVLTPFFPGIAAVHLRDFKVRILDGEDGTAAKTRVLIESSDGHGIWGTVGVSRNIIEASWEALVDSVEYVLYRNPSTPKRRARPKRAGR